MAWKMDYEPAQSTNDTCLQVSYCCEMKKVGEWEYNVYIWSPHQQGQIWTEGGTTPPLAPKCKDDLRIY